MLSEKKELTNALLLTLKSLSNYKYSPEKKKILYLTSQADLKENKSKKELYIINSDGTDAKLISTPGETVAEPTFILKGEKIVYISKGELYFMNIDGSNKKKVFCKKSEINSNV